MMLEVLRLAAEALADPTIGVNAQIAAIATAGAFGTDPVPPTVRVVEPTSDDFAALADAPARHGDQPAVTVMLAGLESVDPHGVVAYRDGRCRLLIRYDAVLDDPSALHRNCLQTMRAVLLSIKAWRRASDTTDALRQRHGVEIIGWERIGLVAPPELSQESAPVTFAAYLDLHIQDTI